MNYTNNPIIKHKAGLLNLAEELGNVSKASRLWVYPEIHSTATKSLLKTVVLITWSIKVVERQI